MSLYSNTFFHWLVAGERDSSRGSSGRVKHAFGRRRVLFSLTLKFVPFIHSFSLFSLPPLPVTQWMHGNQWLSPLPIFCINHCPSPSSVCTPAIFAFSLLYETIFAHFRFWRHLKLYLILNNFMSTDAKIWSNLNYEIKKFSFHTHSWKIHWRKGQKVREKKLNLYEAKRIKWI